jgi:hypothetical protein
MGFVTSIKMLFIYRPSPLEYKFMWPSNEKWESTDRQNMTLLGAVAKTSVKLESNIFCHSSTLKLEAADSSETLRPSYQTAWR